MPSFASSIRVGAASLAVAVGLVSVAACGSSKKTASSPTGTTSASSPASSDATETTSGSPLPTDAGSTDATTSDAGSTDATTSDAGTTSSPASSSSAAAPSGGGATCTDLSDAAASASLGKKVTVKGTPKTPLAGLSICDVTVAGEIYPIQLAVDSVGASELFAVDKQAVGGVTISGLGDQAFHSSIGVEALSRGVDVKVTGPAGPVLSNDFTIPTAVAKAMIAAIH